MLFHHFISLFQLVLTKFFKSELFSSLPKVDHVIKSCKEPIVFQINLFGRRLRVAPGSARVKITPRKKRRHAFSRGVIFTRVRVSLALLSMGLLPCYPAPRVNNKDGGRWCLQKKTNICLAFHEG